jgi:hypothetical protein
VSRGAPNSERVKRVTPVTSQCRKSVMMIAWTENGIKGGWFFLAFGLSGARLSALDSVNVRLSLSPASPSESETESRKRV